MTGLLGKLPTSEDILKTFGPCYDFMAAFQTFFLFNGEIFQLTTYSQVLKPKDYERTIKLVDCLLVLGNENLHSSRKECLAFVDILKKDKKLSKVLMLQNSSSTAAEYSWAGQLERERENA